jgi:hypothetical protein
MDLLKVPTPKNSYKIDQASRARI